MFKVNKSNYAHLLNILSKNKNQMENLSFYCNCYPNIQIVLQNEIIDTTNFILEIIV